MKDQTESGAKIARQGFAFTSKTILSGRFPLSQPLSRPSLNEMNLVFTALLMGGSGVLGSVNSILFDGAILLAFVRLYQCKIGFPTDRDPLLIGAAFALYFVANAISGLLNFNGTVTLRALSKTLPFLGFLFIYGRLALSSREDVLRAVRIGAVLGAYVTFMFVVAEMSFSSHARAEAMAGNPGVLASVCSILYGLCLLFAIQTQGSARWIALLAAVCAGTSLLMTGMRALWPFLIIGPFISLVVLRPRIDWPALRRASLIVAIPLMAAVYFSYDMVETRLERVGTDIARIEHGDYQNSLGERLSIWKLGVELVADRPIFGQGPAVAKRLGTAAFGVSHFHNFLLDAMVKSGILGVAALLGMVIVPLWVAIRRRNDHVSLAGIVILLNVQGALLLSGLVGIMLGHDIHDTLFIYATIVAIYLVLADKEVDAAPQIRSEGG